METQNIINNRYEILNELGRGGMGVVYRCRDRLTRTIVALKQVTTPPQQLQFTSMNSSSDFRLALAREFKVLSSLRHPHIISVLDYGFDEMRQPFFVLEFLDNPATITDYGEGKPLPQQVELLIQLLQALAYLHRRGILHRDLKPDNVLVVDGQVKVLDFGLAITREHLSEEEETVGTLAYMSPEVLQSQTPGEASDLFAVGVIAYELFAGRHPFDTTSIGTLIQSILNENPVKPVWELDITEELKDIVERLLAKDPESRYSDATEIIQRYVASTGRQVHYESDAIRESYLQAAAFVGREAELNTLMESLTEAINCRGSAWLIGGESGIGKSRLMDELRTQSLVAGAVVLRGQINLESGSPFQIWQQILRRLVIQTELTTLESSVLKSLVPDMHILLGREIPDAPTVDSQSAQTRLLSVIEDVFRKQTQPIVLLLEDLQWAGEGLSILKRLNRIVHETPLMIVANYRSEEAPQLQTELAEMRHIQLQRLTNDAIENLSLSILGESGSELVNLLQQETEGNVFFIIEVIRALAEETGQLANISKMALPASVTAGGIQSIVRRRLNHVPDDARILLETAAVAGRELDIDVLQTLAPAKSISQWLISVASVIEVQENRYRFAHDKLREGLLKTILPDQLITLHRQIAQAVETVHGEKFPGVLAYHWKQAGHPEHEAKFSILAAKQSIAESSYHDALTYLTRVEALCSERIHPAELADLMAQAHAGMANLRKARHYWEHAVALYGYPVMVGKWLPRIRLDTLRQIITQFLHRRGIGLKPPQNLDELHRVLQIYSRLQQIYGVSNINIYEFVNFAIRWTNFGDTAADPALKLISRSPFGGIISIVLSQSIGKWYLAGAYSTRIEGDNLARWSLKRDLVFVMGSAARWDEAIQAAHEAMQIAVEGKDLHGSGDTAAFLVITYLIAGKMDEAVKVGTQFREMMVKSGEPIARIGYLYTEPQIWMIRGSDEDYHRLESLLDEIDMTEIQASSLLTHVAYMLYTLVLAWQSGDAEKTESSFQRLLKLLEQDNIALYTTAPQIAFAADIAFKFWEAEPENQVRKQLALGLRKQLKKMSSFIYGSRPLAARFIGWQAYIEGRPKQAQQQFEKSISLARQYHMPYDEALAHYHLGRLIPEKTSHLDTGIKMLNDLGVEWQRKDARTDQP